MKHCIVSFSACWLAWLGRALLRKSSFLASNGPWVHMLHFRDKHSHMLKNSPYSSTQPSTRSRQPRLITFPCLWGFFPFISLSLILPKVFFLRSAGPVLANPIKPLYHTTALMDPIRTVQRARQPIWTTARGSCVPLCGDRQKKCSKGEGEVKRGIWCAEGAEIPVHDPVPGGTSAQPLDGSPSLPEVIHSKKKKSTRKVQRPLKNSGLGWRLFFRVPLYCRHCVELCTVFLLNKYLWFNTLISVNRICGL